MSENIIIVSDLDGTLLDHHTYSFEAAAPALNKIKERQIPLILNSSKTAEEMLLLRATMQNTDPFAFENGAGIFFPPSPREEFSSEYIIEVGTKREEILNTIHSLRSKHEYDFVGFADMDMVQVRSCTGLDLDAAALALKRDFSEPILWEDSEERFVQFSEQVVSAGLTVTSGGRFIHIAGDANKGKAVIKLKEKYLELRGTAPIVIALGDGKNDISMLEAADFPVVITSPVNPPLEISHSKVRVSTCDGPIGWNKDVLQILEELGSI